MDKLTPYQQSALQALLDRKLSAIPKHHLPDISLADVVNQTATATNLRNIPGDLQLQYYLEKRATIAQHDDLAVKDAEDQDLKLTRAIFYYRLSETHQFQRYHDNNRWNLAMFLAILTQHDRTKSRDASRSQYRLYEGAKDFVIAYLEAVMEHHNTPTVFQKRDAFVKFWKGSDYDFFRLGASQSKVMKKEMKRLTKDWQAQLDYEIRRLGDDEYNSKVAKYVGVLVPGRKDQRLWDSENFGRVEGGVGEGTVKMAVDSNEEPKEGNGSAEPAQEESGEATEENHLLKALKVPYDAINNIPPPKTEPKTVVQVLVGVQAVQFTAAGDILEMLLERFD